MAIIQSLAQLERNYDEKGAEIIVDNCQNSIFGGFAPNSKTADVLSNNLGTQTILSGSVNRGKGESSQSLQMIERPLMTSDELKSMPKGNFIVMKTGFNPMRMKLKLFFDWGITFDEPYSIKAKRQDEIKYTSKEEIYQSIHNTNINQNIKRKKGSLKL